MKISSILAISFLTLFSSAASADFVCRAQARWNERGVPKQLTTFGQGKTQSVASSVAMNNCQQQKPQGVGRCILLGCDEKNPAAGISLR